MFLVFSIILRRNDYRDRRGGVFGLFFAGYEVAENKGLVH